MNFTIFIC